MLMMFVVTLELCDGVISQAFSDNENNINTDSNRASITSSQVFIISKYAKKSHGKYLMRPAVCSLYSNVSCPVPLEISVRLKAQAA